MSIHNLTHLEFTTVFNKPLVSKRTTLNKKMSMIFFIFNVCFICFILLAQSVYKTHIIQQNTNFSFRLKQPLLAAQTILYGTVPTTDAPLQIEHGSNSQPTRSAAFGPFKNHDDNTLETSEHKLFISLDAAMSTMLDVSAPTMLVLPARQLPTLDVPTHLALLIGSSSPVLWILDYIASGGWNPHDPGPSTAVGPPTAVEAEAPAFPLYIIWRIRPPLWTFDFITPGPSNPHDPGPPANVAVHPSTLSLYLIFSVIALYAIHDFLCISPRSPSAPVLICSVCL